MSVRPSSEMFWTIMSTFTPVSASNPNTAAAMPGLSATDTRVIFASFREWATPETALDSMISSSSQTRVPGSSVKLDRNCNRTLWRIASSTDLV